jgi:hypothetical protein
MATAGIPGLFSSTVTLPPSFSIAATAFSCSVCGPAAHVEAARTNDNASIGSAIRIMGHPFLKDVGVLTPISITESGGRQNGGYY